MIDIYDRMLGAPPKQSCPKTALAGDLSKPNRLPGVAPTATDPDKEPPAITSTSEGLTWTKVLVGGAVVYVGGKLFGIW